MRLGIGSNRWKMWSEWVKVIRDIVFLSGMLYIK